MLRGWVQGFKGYSISSSVQKLYGKMSVYFVGILTSMIY